MPRVPTTLMPALGLQCYKELGKLQVSLILPGVIQISSSFSAPAKEHHATLTQ